MNENIKKLMEDPTIKACGYFRGRVEGNIDGFIEKKQMERLLSEGTKWQDMGLYTDTVMEGEGIKRMLEDCHRGKINLIVVSSFDRISRNVRFFCNFLHEIFALKVGVYFIDLDAYIYEEPWNSILKQFAKLL